VSTRILDGDGFDVTVFYGGKPRGPCVQITTDDGRYIVLTYAQMHALIAGCTLPGAKPIGELAEPARRGGG
jgi:hypothetical protein